MTFADVGYGSMVLGPEVPALVLSLVVLAFCSSRALKGIADIIDTTERNRATASSE